MTAPDLLFASDIAVPEVWLQLPDGTRVRYVREEAVAAAWDEGNGDCCWPAYTHRNPYRTEDA